MIFKTLNYDLTVFNKTLISTKDHLKSLQTVDATVYNKNDAFNLQGLLVNSSQSVSTFTKLNNAFKAYNGNLSKSTQLQNAYVQAVGKQNVTLGNYLAGLNGAKASMGGYVKSLVVTKAASIGLQVASVALNTAISMGRTLAISALVSQISKWIHAQEEAQQKAIDLTNSYKEQRDSLNAQIEKYKELKETLDNGNLSTDETRSIKEQLLEIQKSLIESYGDEASNIDLVNGKYRDQLGLLSELSKKKADKYVKENRSAYEDAKRELEKIHRYEIGPIFSYDGRDGISDAQKQLYNYIKSYSELFEIRSMYDTSTFNNSDYALTLFVNANADEAKLLIDQFYDDIEKYIKENNLELDYHSLQINLSKVSSDIETDDALKEYREIYDEFMKAEVVRNDTLRPLYQQSIQAIEDYNKALSSGEGVTEAKTNLDALQQSVQNATSELEGSQEVFDGIYDGINKSAESAYSLAQSFENDESVKGYAEQLKGLTYIDLQAINFEDNVQSPGEEAFGALIDILELSEDEVQNLINKLVELGYVQGEVQGSSTNKNSNLSNQLLNSSESLDKFQSTVKSTYDAYSTLLSGNYSSAELLDSIHAINQAASDMGSKMNWELIGDTNTNVLELGDVIDYISEKYAKSFLSDAEIDANSKFSQMLVNMVKESYKAEAEFAGMNAQLDNLQSSYQALTSVIESYNETGYISLDSLQSLLTADENLIAMLEVENGQLAINQAAYENLVTAQLMEFKAKLSNAAVSALEAERDARLEAIESQKEQYEHGIEGIEAQIDAKEKEIKAMQDANGERKRAIDLQKAEYDLQRMQNQKTSFVYKDGQMVYEADTSSIRDAKQEVENAKLEIDISKIEKEIDRLEEEKDLLQERIDLLDKEAEQVNQYYDQLIAQTEKHYDAMVKGLEDYKSQFEALTDLLENAQLEASLSEVDIRSTVFINLTTSKTYDCIYKSYCYIVFICTNNLVFNVFF